MAKSVNALCTYQVRTGAEADFEKLLRNHWPTLHDLELVTDRQPLMFRGRNEDGSTFFVEILEWRDQSCVDSAHELPEVAAIWERMGPLCVARNGRPPMEFPEIEQLV
jgi:hypothetical protein